MKSRDYRLLRTDPLQRMETIKVPIVVGREFVHIGIGSDGTQLYASTEAARGKASLEHPGLATPGGVNGQDETRPESRLWLKDVAEPEIGINDILVHVDRTGICGTDLSIFNWDAWARANLAGRRPRSPRGACPSVLPRGKAAARSPTDSLVGYTGAC